MAVTSLRRWVNEWLERHQHPASQLLHAVGVPLAPVGVVVLAVLGRWWEALAALVVGYVLQFVGHAIEGNDPGEVILVKKLLGKPYVAVAHRSKGSKSAG